MDPPVLSPDSGIKPLVRLRVARYCKVSKWHWKWWPQNTAGSGPILSANPCSLCEGPCFGPCFGPRGPCGPCQLWTRIGGIMRCCTAIAFSVPERCSGLLGVLGVLGVLGRGCCSAEVNEVKHLRFQFSSGLFLSISLSLSFTASFKVRSTIWPKFKMRNQKVEAADLIWLTHSTDFKWPTSSSELSSSLRTSAKKSEMLSAKLLKLHACGATFPQCPKCRCYLLFCHGWASPPAELDAAAPS